jgi:hypothetical protein
MAVERVLLALDVGAQLDHGPAVFESPPGDAVAVWDERKAGELARVERAARRSEDWSLVDVEAKERASVFRRDGGGGAIGTDGQRRHGDLLAIAR